MNNENKRILYVDWLVMWLDYKRDFVKESTYANYTNIIYNHLIPDLGEHYIDELNHNVLQKYLLQKLKSGNLNTKGELSCKAVRDIMSVLKNSLKYAINLEKINQINLEFIYPKVHYRRRMYILTKREQRKITNHILTNLTPRNLGILIALYSGMRIGEICALKWADIDFRNKIIHINKTLQRIYIKNQDGTCTSKLLISFPKTVNSNRDIPISNEFAEVIKKLKGNTNHYVLTQTATCLEPRAYRKYFNSLLIKLKLRHINFHSLRHTFATNCINLGIDYKTVSELLGHSDISITLNLYVHPNLNQKKKCMSIVWKHHF